MNKIVRAAAVLLAAWSVSVFADNTCVDGSPVTKRCNYYQNKVCAGGGCACPYFYDVWVSVSCDGAEITRVTLATDLCPEALSQIMQGPSCN
jgi:hypothetical protein